MPSSEEYLQFVLEQLSGLDGITWRSMMGECIIYFRGKVIGGVYDDRFLIKSTPTSATMMPDAPRELPYEGAKEPLLAADVDDGGFLCRLFEAMYDELPEPKKRR